MKKRLIDFLKKDNRAGGEPADKKESTTMQTEFVKGIEFEENPFEDETPDNVKLYDLDGKEVQQ